MKKQTNLLTLSGERLKYRALVSEPWTQRFGNKGFGTFFTTKQSRYFLLYSHHAQIPFRLVVVKRNRRLPEKTKDFFPMRLEAIQQVTRRRLLFASLLFLRFRRERNRILLTPFCDEVVKPSFQCRDLLFGWRNA